MLDDKITRKGMVETTEGWIPHLRHPVLDIDMPVKLDITGRVKSKRDMTVRFMLELHPPLRAPDTGALVYALPGGGEYSA